MGRRVEDPASCWDRALKLLARQESSCRRIRRKLSQRGYESEEIDEAVSRLLEYGYLDDRRYGTRWTEERLRRGPVGRNRLRADLEARGLDGDLAAEIACELTADDDRESAEQAAEIWRRRRGGDPRALARHLGRLGFSTASIAALVIAAREKQGYNPSPTSDRTQEP
jgi:SOS response regulatory protein OraA/RecX